ncbi:O-antigen ligase [Pedobacter sp. Leaf250]|uniref:O-antigen ligase family protein n=1 Tax=Pedobacter sp. Leaf250 TaxID=2876559 RepID=UPI001E3F1C23|nr:O-antigen ligase family protein [Pedobacter sp. Leaf250]
MFIIFRIIADILWQFKIVSVLVNISMLLAVVGMLYRFKFTTVNIFPIFTLVFFIIVILLSFLRLVDTETSIIFFKTIFSIFLFVIGMVTKRIFRDSVIAAKISIGLIIIHVILAIAKIGYQTWGGAYTFSGLYFFKTDLALSMVLSLIYLLYFGDLKPLFRFLLVLIGLYIIFITNARIHLLSSFLILVIYYFREKIINSPKKTILIGAPLIAIGFLLFLLIIQQFLPPDLLLVDLNDFYSDSNMQGRNVIWETLISKFQVSSIIDQFFGLGLTADVRINSLFANTEEVFNAHSTYLYILISFGYVGCLLFLSFVFQMFKRFFKLAIDCKNDQLKQKILMVFFSIWIVFLVSSFSSVSLIFQQLMWFVFLWAGVLFNSHIFKSKKNKLQ